MREYPIEDDRIVDLAVLKADFMPTPAYIEAHKGLVIPCHDVIIQYEGGALLVMRTDFPAKDILWPIGGRVERGMPIEESLKKKVRKESGLELDEITELGYARTYFRTDPWGHGKGTDTINFMFFAQGKGTFQLDKTVAQPTIVLPDQYTLEFWQSLHPYVQDFMDIVVPLIKK
ncbi:MAG: NUDIX domain-containing protein [Nanoarchaeota archaeon]